MKKTILALAAMSIVFASCVKNDPPPPPPDDSPLKGLLFINEVNGWPSDDPSKSFELYNDTDEPVSLEGFYVNYTEERETWRGRAEDIIPAKGWKLIQGANAGYPGLSTGLSNRNPNIELTLFDPAGNIIDYYVKVPDLRGTPLEFMCHMRIPDAGTWYYIPNSMATPGAANLTTPPTGSEAMPPMEKALRIEGITVSTTTPAPDAAVTIVATISDASGTPTAVLKWEKDGATQTDLTATRDEKEYTFTVPGQVDGTVVNWTVHASNTSGKIAQESGTITWAEPTADYTTLKLNEVNGCSNEKWFEIYNTGTVEINLAGVTAHYSNSEPVSWNPTNTWTGTTADIIPAGGFFATPKGDGSNLGTGLSANNANVRLQLRAPDGTVLDTYEKLKNVNTGQGYDHLTNKSHARIPDGTGPWYYTADGIGTREATNGTSTAGCLKIGEEDGAASTDYTTLRLNEISGANLFIELYNSGTTPVDLEGVRVQRNGGPSAGTEWVGQAGDVIPAGAYRLIAFRNGDVSGYPELTDVIASPSYVGWIVSGGLSNQQILKIALVDPDGIEFDVFIRGDGSAQLPAWGTGGQTQNNTHTYSRMPNGTWAYALPTIGAANGAKVSEIVSPGYLKSELVLNEISGENIFIEIFNSSTTPMNLEGVRIQRNDGPSAGTEWVGQASDVIPAGAYRLIAFRNGDVASYPELAAVVASPAYVDWTVSGGLSDQQTLKIALVNPLGFEFDVFVRGTSWTGPWGTSGQERRPGGVTGLSYSRQTDGTWGWAPGSPGSVNGTTTTAIVNDGYLTAQP